MCLKQRQEYIAEEFLWRPKGGEKYTLQKNYFLPTSVTHTHCGMILRAAKPVTDTECMSCTELSDGDVLENFVVAAAVAEVRDKVYRTNPTCSD